MAEQEFLDKQIELAHGSGGKASRRLVENLIVPQLNNPNLAKLTDSALIPFGDLNVAITTDSFVVKPLEFAGGSIGSLAVHGTCNDLAVAGTKPKALVCTLILEAGLATEVVKREVAAIGDACKRAGVDIVGGDTKVVEHGKADGMYITTCGIGTPSPGVALDAKSVKPGDKVILSGPIGDHGITVLLARGELDIEADLRSDSRSVWPMVEAILCDNAAAVKWMRDPTRGGVATALNELARDSGYAVSIEEERLPVRAVVRGACEVLGLDVLHVANEGQFLAVVEKESANKVLDTLKKVEGGSEASIIGEVVDESPAMLHARTPYGSTRIVDMLVGDQLPRIC